MGDTAEERTGQPAASTGEATGDNVLSPPGSTTESTPESITRAQTVGAIVYFLAHPEVCLDHFENSAFPTDSSGVTFLLKRGLATQSELGDRGAEAIQAGTARRRPREKTLDRAHKAVACFQRLTPSWRLIDGAVPSDERDQKTRYQRGPKWQHNSCALDCVIVAALLLDAGRCQADQLSTDEMLLLRPIPRALLTMIRKPWGGLGVNAIASLRGTLYKMLSSNYPARFPHGEHWGVTSLIEVLFAGLPQLHATWSTVYRCCQHGPPYYYRTTSGDIEARVRMGLPTAARVVLNEDASPVTLDEVFRHGFGPDSLTKGQQESTPSCGYCEGGAGFKRPVLVDRLPPVLVLTEDDFHPQKGRPIGLFDDVLVRCLSVSFVDTEPIPYRLQGFITNLKYHFTLSWINPSATSSFMTAITYDDMAHNGRFSERPDLRTAMPQGASLAAAFFVRVDKSDEELFSPASTLTGSLSD